MDSFTEAKIILNDLDSLMHRIGVLPPHPMHDRALELLGQAVREIEGAAIESARRGIAPTRSPASALAEFHRIFGLPLAERLGAEIEKGPPEPWHPTPPKPRSTGSR